MCARMYTSVIESVFPSTPYVAPYDQVRGRDFFFFVAAPSPSAEINIIRGLPFL